MRFEPAALAGDLARLVGEHWVPHFVPQNYRGEWSVLPLRAPVGARHPILRAVSHAGITDWEDTEALAKAPAFRAVLASLQCPVQAARLMRLAPGSEIKQHRDPDLAPEYGTARLHVPVVTNCQAAFWLNDVAVEMAVGELWFLRLADVHRARNDGMTDRVHLVIDVQVNQWLKAMLIAAASARAKA
jgi:hypothetical protein